MSFKTDMNKLIALRNKAVREQTDSSTKVVMDFLEVVKTRYPPPARMGVLL